MTIRTSLQDSYSDVASRCFAALDHAAAEAEVRRLADAGHDELEIAQLTQWPVADIRRALEGRA